MDGKARMRRQIRSGVRDRVQFVDQLRMKYGMSRVKSLTPKVESRLRSGEQAQITLKVQYISDSIDIGINLTIPQLYPETAVEVEIVDMDEESEENEENEETRDDNILVIQEFLQSYCNSIVFSAEEENQIEMKAAAAMGVGKVATVDTRKVPSMKMENAIVGLDIIEKFNDLIDTHFTKKNYKINTLGEVEEKVFQFPDIAKLSINESCDDDDDDEDEIQSAEDDQGDKFMTKDGKVEVGDELGLGEENSRSYTYKCSKCRSFLFTEVKLTSSHGPRCTSYFLAEDPEDNEDTEETSVDDTDGTSSSGGLMKSVGIGNTQDNAGDLSCKKCGAKVGAWSWVGLSCSCRQWVAPAFQIKQSKVDKH